MTKGRPKNTFSDPAKRMRHWCWAQHVMRIAGVAHVTELDRLSPRHPLVKRLPRTRAFESIGLDGYDPGAIALSHQSLLAYVTSKRRYQGTLKSYNHPLWLHLQERNPASRASESWVATVLSARGALILSEQDEANGYELGFDQYFSQSWGNEAGPPSDIYFEKERFADLDGLLALTLLHRDTVDGMRADQTQWLPYLRSLLSGAAKHFAKEQGFQGEALDTWRLLVETRMLAWRPEITPAAGDMQLAHQQLLEERHGRRRSVGSIDSGAPEKRRQGRAERRWRRQVAVRASLIAVCADRRPAAISEPKLVRQTLLRLWLIEHREAIERHLVRAQDLAIDGTTDLPEEPPLRMPADLAHSRQRPTQDIERWNLYGNKAPYDFIAVEIEPRSSSDAISGSHPSVAKKPSTE